MRRLSPRSSAGLTGEKTIVDLDTQRAFPCLVRKRRKGRKIDPGIVGLLRFLLGEKRAEELEAMISEK